MPGLCAMPTPLGGADSSASAIGDSAFSAPVSVRKPAAFASTPTARQVTISAPALTASNSTCTGTARTRWPNLKSGKLVVYGDVGQTFMYGAKGGEVYVLGNAVGRPLINAAGRPRVVINGTALDFLAESFMAGDPYNGGGFVIVNGLAFDDEGRVVPQKTPYPARTSSPSPPAAPYSFAIRKAPS